MLNDERHHKNDGQHIEEPCTHKPRQRVGVILSRKPLEHLARHEEHKPDAQLEDKPRKLRTLEMLVAFMTRHHTRDQLYNHNEDHRDGKNGPDAKHRAKQTPERRQRNAMPRTQILGRREHALHESREAAVAV